MNFFETRRGAKFYDHDVPKMIKAVEQLATAVEKANEKVEEKENINFRDEMMNRILQLIEKTNFDANEICRTQLKALWTAYCIFCDYEVDTAPYDQDLERVWNAVIAGRDILGSSDWLDDFGSFGDVMCEDLV